MKKRTNYEYVSRMDAQRQALNFVNSLDKTGEQLFGLSQKAIQRWFEQSSFAEKHKIKTYLQRLSLKLSFLANESQQQITQEYKTISKEYFDILNELKEKISP